MKEGVYMYLAREMSGDRITAPHTGSFSDYRFLALTRSSVLAILLVLAQQTATIVAAHGINNYF